MAVSSSSYASVPRGLPSLQLEDYDQLETIRSGLESELDTAKTGCCSDRKRITYLSGAIEAIDQQMKASFKKTITERNKSQERTGQLQDELAESRKQIIRAQGIAAAANALAASSNASREQTREKLEGLKETLADTEKSLSNVKQEAHKFSRGGGLGLGIGVAGTAIICGLASVPVGIAVAASGIIGAFFKSRK